MSGRAKGRAREQRARIKQADLEYKRLMHEKYPEKYTDPDRKAKEAAAKKSKTAEGKAERQRQKQLQKDEEKRAKDADLAQERKDYIEVYKVFLKQRTRWNTKKCRRRWTRLP